MEHSGESLGQALLIRINELINAGEIKLLYIERSGRGVDPAYLRELAEIKRLLERWSADESFRVRITEDPGAAGRSLGLSVDAAGLVPLWDQQRALATPCEEYPLAVLRYKAFILEKVTHRNRIRAGSTTSDPRYRAWRRRQMARVLSEVSPQMSASIVHAPFCIELCQGCSVGCWFCGISAPKLVDIFAYTDDNAALYCGVIQTLQGLFGEQAGYGFNYWATDPMDNPDYERFMIDFQRLTGSFPQTTTALALKDLARTRALLELSRQKGGRIDRFSLLSLKQLDQVHAAFTPDELLDVELVLQNREAHQAKSRAGRAFTGRRGRSGQRALKVAEQVSDGTIACVSGFLISMVKRCVQLISPCKASEQHPLGYIVFDEAQFTDVGSFRDAVTRMVDAHMHVELRGEDRVAFYEHLCFEELPDGFGLSSPHLRKQFTDGPFLTEIGRAVNASRATVDEIVDAVGERSPAQGAGVWHALRMMFDEGVLDTRVRPPATAPGAP